MNVLLIRPPISYVNFSTGSFPFSLYTMFMTRYPPMALMYLASLLRQDGHKVALLDAEAEELDARSAILRMEPFRPDLIIGNVNVYNSFRNFQDLISLKEHLQTQLVVRGHYPGEYPDESMSHAEVDVVMTGKGFASVRPLVRALEEGNGLAKVRGILFRQDGRIVRTPSEKPVRDLDTLPFPARDLVDPDLYVTNLSYRRPFTTLFGSLGCPFNCIYCTDRKVPYSRRSVGSVIAELAECVEKHGIREVAFLDPTFTVKRDWVAELCEEIVRRRMGLTFTMRTRPDLLDPDLVRQLARAGCVRISLGIESGDPQILEIMNRSGDVDRIRQATRWIQEAGIMAFGYFMVGNKGETHQSLQRTLDLLGDLPLHFAQFFQTLPLLGTEVLERSKQELGHDIWHEISQGRYPSPEEFRSLLTDLSLAELQAWSRKLYVHFFLSPRRWRYLLKLKYLPGYAARQVQILLLVSRLLALRQIRKQRPAFRLARYPHVRNGGPGDAR